MDDQVVMETDPVPADDAEDNSAFSSHYKRLQQIEKHVTRAIEAASITMYELAHHHEEGVSRKDVLYTVATEFVAQIKKAQELVLEAIRSAAPERNFEANNYFPLVQAMVSAEKLDAVSVHISGISKILRQHRQQQPGQDPEGNAPPQAAAEPGAD